MKSRQRFSIGALVTGAMLVMLGSTAPSTAVAADFVLDLPAGLACAGFDLRVEITAPAHRVNKEFYDKDGNLVRVLTAGKGSSLTFINMDTDSRLALDSNGSVEHVKFNADATQTWMTTGHNVLILFPTDVPAGPSTTLYIGRVVFTVDTSGIFTLQSHNGSSMDICAALSD